MTISRRELLSVAGAFVLSGCAARVTSDRNARFFERTGLPIGLQLYTLGDLVEKDLEGTLKSLAAIGYRAVELAGFHGRTATELRAALNAAGVICTSAHIPPRRWNNQRSLTDDLEKLAVDLQLIGAQYVVVPNPMPLEGEVPSEFVKRLAGRITVDDWKHNAAFLNETGDRLRQLGLHLAYHNHNQEFRPIENTTGLEILLKETDPASVRFQMDVAWVTAAGHDPIQLFKAHPGRFHLMHVKDVKPSTPANYEGKLDSTEVGSGTVDWKRVLPAAFAAGVRHFYVEQEAPFERSRLEAVAKSHAFLSGLVA